MEYLIILMVLISNSKKGSSTVEAALVLPVLILIIVSIISASMRYEKDIESTSLMHLTRAYEGIEDTSSNPEDIVRARWLLE